MAETSTSYGKLLDGFPLFPLLNINFPASVVALKDTLCRLHIPIDLPAAQTLVVGGFVADEPQDVFRRIA